MKRIGFIDQLKAVSIFFIVYGHNDYTSAFSNFLSSFLVPLFFFLSGFVRKDSSTLSFYDFFKRLGKRLIVPYFLLSSVLFIIWFFVGRHYGTGESLSPMKNFLGIFYSQGGSQYMDWGIPMWFLTALFCVLFIDFFVARLARKWQPYTTVFVALLGYCYFEFVGIHLPWSLDVALVVYPFYFIGVRIQEGQLINRISDLKVMLVIGVLFFMHLGLSQLNGHVLFYHNHYGSFPLMYINGFLGLFWLFLLFSRLPAVGFITWLGRNTLPVLALHLTAMSFIKAVLLFGFETQNPDGVIWYFLFSVLQIVLLVPVILLMNRCMPQMVGVSRSSEKV